jgi:hypothetical protein
MTSRELSFKMEFWESQNFMFINQLKTVTMDLSNWGHDVELMKYLLKNTKELEMMAISYSLPMPTNLMIGLMKYKKPSTKLIFSRKSSILRDETGLSAFLPQNLRWECVRYMRS